MKIIGLSCFYHDSGASLIIDEKIVTALQEERLTRKKNDSSFPSKSIKFILESNDLKIEDIDYFVYYEKPIVKFERLLKNYILNFPFSLPSFLTSLVLWIKLKLNLKKVILNEIKVINNNTAIDKNKLLFSDHHLSHAASAFFPSPFDKSLIFTFDGVGEWATTSVSIGEKNNIKTIKEIYYPDSLGLLYSSLTYFLGFKVNSDEYKVMGLAPFGEPIYTDIFFNNIIKLHEDGSFKLNQKYFSYSTRLVMTNLELEKLFGIKRRLKDEKIEKYHMDLAASLQKTLEIVITKIVNSFYNEYKIENICLAGGVALNCVANAKIFEKSNYKNIWVQPASGDAGGSLGAAQAAYYMHLKNERKVKLPDSMKGSYLGPSYSNEQIKNTLDTLNIKYEYIDDKELFMKIAENLEKNKVVGWFNGRMEFGPRALGNRSILASALDIDMQKILNHKIKFREGFRPFAPIILKEYMHEWFESKLSESNYMLFTMNVKKDKIISGSEEKLTQIKGFEKLNVHRSEIQSVTHVDYSARIQTIDETNPRLKNLLESYMKITNVPILINTSFNVNNEPIVCSPEDAISCFYSTNIDILVLQNYVVYK